MNKKGGELAFLLLVVVAIVLVVACLFVFAGFSKNYKEISLSNSLMLSKIDFGYNYILSSAKLVAKDAILSVENPNLVVPQNFKSVFASFANKRDYQVYEAGNFFRKIREGNFSFDFDKNSNTYSLKIEGVIAQAENKNNQARRDFDLCMVFGLDGNYVKNCEIGK